MMGSCAHRTEPYKLNEELLACQEGTSSIALLAQLFERKCSIWMADKSVVFQLDRTSSFATSACSVVS
jgi:hypothetical protein